MATRVAWAVLIGVLMNPLVALAEVRLPKLFSDHMVLQRDVKLPVWGWADAGEAVTVSLAGQTAKTTAGPDGKWSVTLAPLPAGGPFELTVAGTNTLKVIDVLVGEVWVCSGQSNMEMTLNATYEAAKKYADQGGVTWPVTSPAP